jgi:hypothetical protein
MVMLSGMSESAAMIPFGVASIRTGALETGPELGAGEGGQAVKRIPSKAHREAASGLFGSKVPSLAHARISRAMQ